MEEKQQVSQTLYDKCETIKEILSKANGIAAKIIGGPVSMDKELKEPVGTLEILGNELIIIQNHSEMLFEYLAKMDRFISD